MAEGNYIYPRKIPVVTYDIDGSVKHLAKATVVRSQGKIIILMDDEDSVFLTDVKHVVMESIQAKEL